MPPPNAIPDRWTDYKPIGNKIRGTRFIAFKVPLRSNVNECVEEEIKLDCDILLDNVPDLGMIIDLTNTNRYYDPEYFKKKGVEYRKLMIPGHQTPAPHLIRTFNQYVKEYLKKNKHNNKLIGVHCTHGVNRTGFLICNFMVTELTRNPDDAIQDFNEARGHSIERINYIAALKKMKKTKSEEARHSREKSNSNKFENRWNGKERSRSGNERFNLEQENWRSRGWRNRNGSVYNSEQRTRRSDQWPRGGRNDLYNVDQRMQRRRELFRDRNNSRRDNYDNNRWNANSSRFQWKRRPEGMLGRYQNDDTNRGDAPTR